MNALLQKYGKLGPRICTALLALSSFGSHFSWAQVDLSTAPTRVYALLQEHRYSDAIAQGESARIAADQTLPKEDMLRVQIIEALADAESQSGDYAKAVEVLQSEIRSFEADGIKTVGLAFLYQRLASPCGMLGRNNEAEAHAEHAVELLESLLLPEDPRIAMALYTLAVQQGVLMRYADEMHSLKRSLRILDASKSPESIQTLKLTLLAIATIYDRGGDDTQASIYRNRALALSTKSLGSGGIPDDYTEASEQGIAAMRRGDLVAARTFFERELNSAVLHFGDESTAVQTVREYLALVYFEQRDRDRAKPLVLKTVEGVYRNYETYFALMTEQERLEFTVSADNKLSLFCSYVHDFHDADPELIGEMYNFAIWTKGAVLASTKSIEKRLRSTNDPNLNHLRGQLESLRQQYRTSTVSTSPNSIQLKNQMELVEADIAKELGVPRLVPVTWRDIKRRLGPTEAAVEFIRFHYLGTGKGTLYSALLMRPQWDNPKYVYLGNSEEIEQKQIHSYALYATARLYPNSPELEFWNRVEDALGSGVSRIYLTTDGVLNNISFSVIPDKSGKLLADKYDLRYLFSTRSLNASSPAKPTPATAVLVGNPNFDLSVSESEIEGHSATLKDSLVPKHETWAPLPDTSRQIDLIKETLDHNKWRVEVFTRDTATKSLIVARTVRPGLLHFATHGFSSESIETASDIFSFQTDSAMLKSGLVLSGANSPGSGGKNALLTSYEITSLDLSGTDLVVLSACDTGLGETLSGGETFGLRRAFQLAGAKSVLMTMWNAPAQETTDLINAFYSNWLAGSDIHDALRAAQAATRSKSSQPYFWGAFVLIE
jgi:CHAT domain-containing protein/tetratricopeptide (TPR) repeat protein